MAIYETLYGIFVECGGEFIDHIRAHNPPLASCSGSNRATAQVALNYSLILVPMATLGDSCTLLASAIKWLVLNNSNF